VTPNAKKITAALLLGLLGLPTGVCSLYFTPMGIISMFGHDSLEHSIGVFALICSGVGWAICALTIWGAIRLNRSAKAQNQPTSVSNG
jgi:hypothetical protein